ATDSGAESVALSLMSRFGAHSVRIVRPEMLRLASWSHRVDSKGKTITRVTVPRAEPIEDAGVAAVLNRIRYLPVPRFHRASAKDRDYAGIELQALVGSWLAGFGTRVVHVVREHPWLTPVLPRPHWAAPAARCGLPVAVRTVCGWSRAPRAAHHVALREPHERPITGSEAPGGGVTSNVVVAGNRVGGMLSSAFGPRCVR